MVFVIVGVIIFQFLSWAFYYAEFKYWKGESDHFQEFAETKISRMRMHSMSYHRTGEDYIDHEIALNRAYDFYYACIFNKLKNEYKISLMNKIK